MRDIKTWECEAPGRAGVGGSVARMCSYGFMALGKVAIGRLGKKRSKGNINLGL